MIPRLAKHKILIKKHSTGEIYECNHANVQPKKVFIHCPEIPVEEEDIIIHKISENNIQEFVVIEPNYYDVILEPHYQAKVMRKNQYEKSKDSEKNSINIIANNSQININSNGNTYNFNNIPFNEIREKLNEIPDESVKKEALICLENMENSENQTIFNKNYSELRSIIADNITILTFVVTLISNFI